MNTTAKGTERQYAFSSAVEGGTGASTDSAPEAVSPHATAQSFETSDQLRRILAEVQNSRLAGNAALRDLENRLGALEQSESDPFDDDLSAQFPSHPGARRGWNARDGLPSAPLGHTALPDDERQEDFLSLSDRLRELSGYLHASLAQRAAAHAAQAKPSRAQTARYHGYTPQHHAPEAPHMQAQSRFFSERQPHPRVQAQPVLQPKLTPSAPVLDRAWFEDRFTQLRHSIDDAAEVPTKRIDALEEQFRLLMERLDARETAQGGMGAVEAGLKNLAAYLDDSKKWATQHDRRQRNVEDRLDQLSGLVAQSHAAISATAKGLEIVARGTGSELAQRTANLVTAQVEEKIARLQPGPQLDNLSRELANLTTQQRQYARSTDQRLKELRFFWKAPRSGTSMSLRPQSALQSPALTGELEARGNAHSRADRQTHDAAVGGDKHSSTARQQDIDEGDDYDRDLIAAAQRAARLAEGPRRDAPAHGETVRYQIPYGEFLPEGERRHSHLGLVAAAVILLLASAAMLYVNLREKDVFGWARDRTTSAGTVQESTTANEPAPQPIVTTPPTNTTAAIRSPSAPASGEAALEAQPGGEKIRGNPVRYRQRRSSVLPVP